MRHIGDRLPVSRLPANVNKAVSEQEMRKGEKEDRREEIAAVVVVGGTIIKASFLQRAVKSRPRRAAEHKSISFSRLQAPRF